MTAFHFENEYLVTSDGEKILISCSRFLDALKTMTEAQRELFENNMIALWGKAGNDEAQNDEAFWVILLQCDSLFHETLEDTNTNTTASATAPATTGLCHSQNTLPSTES